MGRLEMRPALKRFPAGAVVCLVLGLVLASTPSVRGQNVAQPPPAAESPPRAGVPQEPSPLDGKLLPPGVTVERRGRLLVLTYGSKSAGGASMSNVNSRDEPPGFVIYQGQWPIASGKFEFG
jgi:hypothetical protein